MPGNDDRPRRVLLLVTETSAVEKLWRTLVDQVADAQAEIVAVFVSDDRWHRAASLPFTREYSRLRGGSEVFTRHRAEQIIGAMFARAQERISQLAAEQQLQLVFERLPVGEPHRIREFVRVEHDILIVPSTLRSRPEFAELAQPEWQVILVDDEEPECPTGSQ